MAMTDRAPEVKGCLDIKELCGDFSDSEYGFHCRLAELYQSWKAGKKHGQAKKNVQSNQRVEAKGFKVIRSDKDGARVLA